MNERKLLSETCVCTIALAATLDAAHASGGEITLSEGKRWVEAARLLKVAQSSNYLLPVVFAPAEATRFLIYYGFATDIIVSSPDSDERGTTYTVRGLTALRSPRRQKTDLVVASSGQHIPPGHIRPYVLCKCPSFVVVPDDWDAAGATTP